MKHVWILNHYAQTPGGPGGTRHLDLARHLPAYGWKASIVGASTDHGTGEQRRAGADGLRMETVAGVPFLWLPARSYRGNGFRRVLNMLDYTSRALVQRNLDALDPPDAIIGSSVHPLAAWAARRLARRHGVPFIFEVRDLWPQTLIDLGRLSPNHPAATLMRWLERSLYRSAARVVVLLPLAADYIAPLGVDRSRIEWVPNGVDVERFPAPDPRPASDGLELMYLGSHGLANGLEVLVEAMRIVAATPGGDRVSLRLVGDGQAKPGLIAAARAAKLSNVAFEDAVAKERVPALAAEADAFVICVRDLPGLYRFGISMNKIFDYMAAGRPTVIAAAVDNPIAETGGGVMVRPDDASALAGGIMKLAAMTPDARRAMGLAARKGLEERYDMARLAGRLAKTLDEAVTGP